MNRKLRLLVTTKCPNHCELCCNNSWDFSKLPIVNNWNYDEIMITGGEPLLFTPKLEELISHIKNDIIYTGNKPKIYIYTAQFSYRLVQISHIVDGIVLTPHKSKDIEIFPFINQLMIDELSGSNKSFRLNLFADIKALLPKDIDLSLWKVKDMEWIKDCPVPRDEDFRRINELW